MRSLGPVPLTLERSTPSSRANPRTEGEACAARKACASTASADGAAAALPGGCSPTGAADGAAARSAFAGAPGAVAGASDLAAALGSEGRAPLPSSVRITLPSLTLSPILTRNSLITPAEGAGTSIVALSDSSVTSESSAFTLSPGLTKTSMTGTSLKSPMSGTLTSMVLMVTFLFHEDTRKPPRFFVFGPLFPGASLRRDQTVHGA